MRAKIGQGRRRTQRSLRSAPHRPARRQPVSHLVGTPNFFSLVVAVVAGIVGVVSLTLAWAYDSWVEGLASLGQLGLNLVVLIAVGALTLAGQRRVWRDPRRGR